MRQERGGISRYFAELIHECNRDAQLQIKPQLLFSRCTNAHMRETVPELTSALAPLRPVPRGVPRLVNQSDALKDSYLRYRAGHSGDRQCDWLHATYYRPMNRDLARADKLAITIYDMTPEILGASTSTGPHRGKHELAKRADLIFCISQTSAQHLNDRIPGLADKIVVTPLGVRAERFSAVKSPNTSVDFPYLLFVGSRTGYKRFDLAVLALARVRERGYDIGLAIAGAPLNASELAFLDVHLPSNRLHGGTPSDTELVELYQHASAFVFTSEHEGFGLPILEAFAAGCPVIASDIPVFHEVAGDAARYFESGSVESLTEAIMGVLTDDERRRLRQEVGMSKAQQATWQQTASKTAAAYHSYS